LEVGNDPALQSEIFNLKWQQIPPFFMIRMGVAGGESSELISFSQSSSQV
jgi:hypothetical protein